MIAIIYEHNCIKINGLMAHNKNSKNDPELAALRDQHEIAVMELTDLKEDYEKIKKLNTTLVENFNKGPQNTLREIKLIIQGGSSHDRLSELQAQVESLNNLMEQKVEQRVHDITKNYRISKRVSESQEGTSPCQKCKQLEMMQTIAGEKNELIDELRIENEALKVENQILKNKVKSLPQSSLLAEQSKIEELKQTNKILENNLRMCQDRFDENLHMLDQEWKAKYENLNEQFEVALEELENFKRLKYDQGLLGDWESGSNINLPFVKYGDSSEKEKENLMKKEIKSLVGELSNLGRGSGIRSIKKVVSMGSRVSNLESDYSNFSIKDAINRPNQFTFY